MGSSVSGDYNPFGQMGEAFAARKAGVSGIKNQMGKAGFGAGIASGAGQIMGGVTQLAAIGRQGERGTSAQTAANKSRAQAGLNIASGAASMAGPWGMVAAAPLQLVSMLLNIKGPRQRRREQAEQRQRSADEAFVQNAQAMVPPVAATLGGAPAQSINNSPTAATATDFSGLVPTGRLLGL